MSSYVPSRVGPPPSTRRHVDTAAAKLSRGRPAPRDIAGHGLLTQPFPGYVRSVSCALCHEPPIDVRSPAPVDACATVPRAICVRRACMSELSVDCERLERMSKSFRAVAEDISRHMTDFEATAAGAAASYRTLTHPQLAAAQQDHSVEDVVRHLHGLVRDLSAQAYRLAEAAHQFRETDDEALASAASWGRGTGPR